MLQQDSCRNDQLQALLSKSGFNVLYIDVGNEGLEELCNKINGLTSLYHKSIDGLMLPIRQKKKSINLLYESKS